MFLGACALVGSSPALAQLPNLGAGLQAETVTPEDVTRANAKREIDRIIEDLREAYTKGEFDKVETLLLRAEQLEPENRAVVLYRNFLKAKLKAANEKATRAGSRVPTLGGFEAPPLIPVTSEPPAAQISAATPPPLPPIRPAAAPVQRAKGIEGFFHTLGENRKLQKALFVLGGIVLVLGGAVIFTLVRSRRNIDAALSQASGVVLAADSTGAGVMIPQVQAIMEDTSNLSLMNMEEHRRIHNRSMAEHIARSLAAAGSADGFTEEHGDVHFDPMGRAPGPMDNLMTVAEDAAQTILDDAPQEPEEFMLSGPDSGPAAPAAPPATPKPIAAPAPAAPPAADPPSVAEFSLSDYSLSGSSNASDGGSAKADSQEDDGPMLSDMPSAFAPTTPSLPAVTEPPPVPPPVPPPAAPGGSGGLVSFEDLGINFGPVDSEPEPAPDATRLAPPKAPPVDPPTPVLPPAEPSLSAALPTAPTTVPTASENADSYLASIAATQSPFTAPAPTQDLPEHTPTPLVISAVNAEDPIRVDGMSGSFAPPERQPETPKADEPISLGTLSFKPKPAEAPAPELPTHTITPPPGKASIPMTATEDVIRIPLPPRPAGAAPAGGAVDGVAADDSIFIPAAQAYSCLDGPVVSHVPADQTLHGQDTLPLAPGMSQAYASGLDPLGGAGPLDETRAPFASAPRPDRNPGSSTPFPAVSTPPPGDSAAPKGTAVDARSERMFQEQLSKAARANSVGDWKGAVHALSIAAAIHPENEQVMNDLKVARDKKRQAESQ